MTALMNSPELREVYNANMPRVTQFYTSTARTRPVREGPAARSLTCDGALTAAQRAVIEHELRDFRLGGDELPADKKARFTEVREKLSALTSRFSDNVLDATNAYAHTSIRRCAHRHTRRPCWRPR